MNFNQLLKSTFAFGLLGQLVISGQALQMPVAGQTKQAAPAAGTAAPKIPVQGVFWKATNGTNNVYLLGSIHLASDKMYPLPAVMENDFKESKTLVVEVDLSKVDQGKLATFMQEKGMYPAGDSLLTHLKADDKKKLQAFCDKYNFPMMAIERMKPWIASLMLSVLPFMDQGMKADLGIDQHFLDEANKTKKTIDQVEDMNFQLNLLSSATDEEALAGLHDALNTAAGSGSKFATDLQDDWIKGDAEGIYKLTSASRDPKGADRKLLEDRNPHMADVAEKYLKGTSPCFFVVGAAHLIGPEGVIAILRKRGYTVTQILTPAK